MTEQFYWYRRVGDKLCPLQEGDIFDPKCNDLCAVSTLNDPGPGIEIIIILASRKVLCRINKEWTVSDLNTALLHHSFEGMTIDQFIIKILEQMIYYHRASIQIGEVSTYIPVFDVPDEIKREVGWS